MKKVQAFFKKMYAWGAKECQNMVGMWKKHFGILSIKVQCQDTRQRLKKYFETQWKIATGAPSTVMQASFADRITLFITKQTANGPLLILKLIALFMFLFITWAIFFSINETVKATGEIIPSKHLQKIGSLEGGIISDIHVHEGAHIKAGQPLVSLDPTETKSKEEEYKRNYYRNLATIQRLKAQINHQSLTISKDVQKDYPEFARQEEETFKSENERLDKEKIALSEEISSKQHLFNQAAEKLKFSEKQLPLLEEEYKTSEALLKKGLYSKFKTLDTERQKIDLEKDIATLKEQMPELEAEIKQAQAKFEKAQSEFTSQWEKDLKEAQTHLDEAKSNKETAEDRIKRTVLSSPIEGIVKDMNIKTIGGVVRPGEEVLTIVPVDDALLIEAKVMPSDIGFIYPGQSVSIKITTFDYTIFGRLKGRVEAVSPDVSEDKQGKTFFKVTVAADHNYLEKDGKKFYLGVGMTADLDMEIGKHSVMRFILKPILKGFQGALTER